MAAVVGPAKLWSQTVFSFRSLPGSGLPLASPFPGQDLADLLGPEAAPALKSDYLDWLGSWVVRGREQIGGFGIRPGNRKRQAWWAPPFPCTPSWSCEKHPQIRDSASLAV